MKRILSILLIFSLCFSLCPTTIFAQKGFSDYTEDEKEFVYSKYLGKEVMLESLFAQDTGLAYWNLTNQIENKPVMKWLLDRASEIIEEEPDKKDYAEMLANLMAMQSGDIAKQVQNQSQYDDLKNGLDYTMDIVEIATDFVGGAELFEEISPIIDAATGGVEVLIENADIAKYYETAMRDYSQSKLFLEAVYTYAENEALRETAASLLGVNDILLQKRLEHFADITETFAVYEAEFFVDHLSFALLKETEIYQKDKTVAWFVDYGETIKDTFGVAKGLFDFTFHMMMLAGNIGFGTGNTFHRYQEMKTMSDIAGAIVEANHQIQIPQDGETDTVLADIQTKCAYYKMLITTHARGEYLLYHLLVSDASILSEVRVLFDAYKNPEDTTESWYDAQVDCLLKYYDMLENMFAVSDEDILYGLYDDEDIPDDAVEFNGHYYYLYDAANLSTEGVNSWEDAQRYCENVNGYLATITSQEENDFLYSYIIQEGYTGAYFGFTDKALEGDWVWGNGEAVTYTNWYENEPNNESATENYGMFYDKFSDGTWNDGDFGEYTQRDTLIFVCEWGEYKIEASKQLHAEDAKEIYDGDMLTVTGTLIERDYEINSENKGTVYILQLKEAMHAALYSEFWNYDGKQEVISEIQIAFLPELMPEYLLGREITVCGEVMYAHTGHHQTIFLLNDTDVIDSASDSVSVSAEREIVLVLDTSGSMNGEPMEETKKASSRFLETILNEDAAIGVVTYDNSAARVSDFAIDKNSLNEAISDIRDGGGTNIEAGLAEAYDMLCFSDAEKRIIVLMSDGEPNDGKVSEELIEYADELKQDGIRIYTLGFFGDLGSYKSSAQLLMEKIASDGCHYEVADADDLVFFFGDMADQINGQKYIYIRIACPVDVAVTYAGETLSSAEDTPNFRTNFGTLTFEENEEKAEDAQENRIKVLRLKEGADYPVQITGTGQGLMQYTIGFMDENGEYSDLRRFENVKITRRTKIDTIAKVSDTSQLQIDENGDGKYDLKLQAGENGYGEEVKDMQMLYIVAGGGIGVLLAAIVIVAYKKGKKKHEEKGKGKM